MPLIHMNFWKRNIIQSALLKRMSLSFVELLIINQWDCFVHRKSYLLVHTVYEFEKGINPSIAVTSISQVSQITNEIALFILSLLLTNCLF